MPVAVLAQGLGELTQTQRIAPIEGHRLDEARAPLPQIVSLHRGDGGEKLQLRERVAEPPGRLCIAASAGRSFQS